MKVYAIVRMDSHEYGWNVTLMTDGEFDTGKCCPLFTDKKEAQSYKRKLGKYGTKIIELEVKP